MTLGWLRSDKWGVGIPEGEGEVEGQKRYLIEVMVRIFQIGSNRLMNPRERTHTHTATRKCIAGRVPRSSHGGLGAVAHGVLVWTEARRKAEGWPLGC